MGLFKKIKKAVKKAADPLGVVKSPKKVLGKIVGKPSGGQVAPVAQAPVRKSFAPRPTIASKRAAKL